MADTEVKKERNSVEKLFDDLQAKRAQITAKLKPLQEKRDAAIAKMQPFEAEAREIQQEIKKYQGEDLVKLDKQISQLARALGAKTLVAEAR